MSETELNSLLQVLIDRNAIIVHCAGYAKGIGNSTTNNYGYLERLQEAAKNNFELSCSTVRDGDRIDGQRTNYTGYMGLMLRPNASNSLTFTCHEDAGSEPNLNLLGRRSNGNGVAPATPDSLEQAINNRDADKYNEIGIKNYSVLGIFVEIPILYIEQGLEFEVSLADAKAAFPHFKFFVRRCGRFYRLSDNDSLMEQIGAADLYN